MKLKHEIRDPIHNFIIVDSDERAILDSPPVQRLRDVHQLAMTYLVYPGAVHSRFEHSLGVMEVATRIYNTLTSEFNLTDETKALIGFSEKKVDYWRGVVRMAALCHDLGHMPFSHVSESLLPKDFDHERLTYEFIMSEPLCSVFPKMDYRILPEDVVKVALGIKEYGPELDLWEQMLSEIITGSAFGADRIDYLLRDSHHAGVAYGRFDHYRLIDSLRFLPGHADRGSPALGIEKGGLQSAEALLLARYYMFTQLYQHRVRAIYDIHLTDFMRDWLPNQGFAVGAGEEMKLGDSDIIVAMKSAAADEKASGHAHALRILNRKHFVEMYEPSDADTEQRLNAVESVRLAAITKFGEDKIRSVVYKEKKRSIDFPVLMPDGSVESGLSLSGVLPHIPSTATGYVFVNPDVRVEAEQWIKERKAEIIDKKESN